MASFYDPFESSDGEDINRVSFDHIYGSSTGHRTKSNTPTTRSTSTDVPWQKDQDVDDCRICSIHFTLITRRHHCRACGQIICSACSEFKGKTRVCSLCNGRKNVHDGGLGVGEYHRKNRSNRRGVWADVEFKSNTAISKTNRSNTGPDIVPDHPTSSRSSSTSSKSTKRKSKKKSKSTKKEKDKKKDKPSSSLVDPLFESSPSPKAAAIPAPAQRSWWTSGTVAGENEEELLNSKPDTSLFEYQSTKENTYSENEFAADDSQNNWKTTKDERRPDMIDDPLSYYTQRFQTSSAIQRTDHGSFYSNRFESENDQAPPSAAVFGNSEPPHSQSMNELHEVQQEKVSQNDDQLSQEKNDDNAGDEVQSTSKIVLSIKRFFGLSKSPKKDASQSQPQIAPASIQEKGENNPIQNEATVEEKRHPPASQQQFSRQPHRLARRGTFDNLFDNPSPATANDSSLSYTPHASGEQQTLSSSEIVLSQFQTTTYTSYYDQLISSKHAATDRTISSYRDDIDNGMLENSSTSSAVHSSMAYYNDQYLAIDQQRRNKEGANQPMQRQAMDTRPRADTFDELFNDPADQNSRLASQGQQHYQKFGENQMKSAEAKTPGRRSRSDTFDELFQDDQNRQSQSQSPPPRKIRISISRRFLR